MARWKFMGAAVAAVLAGATPAARADVLTACDSLTTIGAWGLAGSCAIGEMIFTVSPRRRGVDDYLVAFDFAGNAASVTVTSPGTDPLFGGFGYTVAIDAHSAVRIVEMQLYGTRQALAGDNQGAAIVTAIAGTSPNAFPVVTELSIGNDVLPEASPQPLGAPPIPSDPSLFDSAPIDAQTLEVGTRIVAAALGREGRIGLESVTTVFVQSAADVPAPSSLALIVGGLAAGALLRRRR